MTTPTFPEKDDTVGLRLPHKDPAAPSRLRVLSLGGGGYRGLFTARLLERLEERFRPKPIQECFDVFAGTSIGGLLASGLAVGISAKALHAIFKAHGQQIFPKKRFPRFRQFIGPLFDSSPLAAAIKECLGNYATTPIRDVEKALLVTAVNWVTGAPTIFRSGGLGANMASADSLLDVCLATSAAPSYFHPHMISGAPMLDGGLVANNPDGIVLLEVLRRWPTALPDIEMLSLGTAGVGSGGMSGDVPRSMAAWLTPLIPFMVAAQERLAAEQVQALLGARYLRLNHAPQPKQRALSEMTVVDASMTATLEALADHTIDQAMTNHLPHLTRLFS